MNKGTLTSKKLHITDIIDSDYHLSKSISSSIILKDQHPRVKVDNSLSLFQIQNQDILHSNSVDNKITQKNLVSVDLN
mgnify:CR=1 FL=1